MSSRQQKEQIEMSTERVRGWFAALSGKLSASSPEETLESRLRCGVSWLAAKPEAAFQVTEAKAYLRRLPPDRLLDVDERMRAYTSPLYGKWLENGVHSLLNPKLDPSSRQSLLFLSAGHPDGRVREATARVLPSFPSYLTLAAALIRSGDWVDEVRRSARIAVERLLPLCLREDVIALWPLVLRLQSRERVSPEWFHGCLEGWMLREESRPSLRLLIDSEHASVRAWAIRSSLEAGIAFEFDLLDVALRDADPRLGLLALRYLDKRPEASTRLQQLAGAGLRAPHPVIRRESLQILSGPKGMLTRNQVLALLLDTSAGVRSRAAFILRNQFAEDPAPHWRAALNEEHPSAPNALASLADHVLPEDEALMRRWLAAPRSLTRAQALRGLVKAGGQPSDTEFSTLLDLGGNRLLHPLGKLVGAGMIPLDVDRVSTLLVSPSSTAMALGNLRAVLRSAPHWSRLMLLLCLSTNRRTAQEWWPGAVSDWVDDSDRYVPLGHSTRILLLQRLEARREEMRSDWYTVIRAAIERH